MFHLLTPKMEHQYFFKLKLPFQTSQIQNEMYLEEWRGTARSVCEITGTDGVLARMMKNTVEQLQQKEINLTAEKAELESQLTTALHVGRVAIVS